jgi:molybdopterin converting factor subunit 1
MKIAVQLFARAKDLVKAERIEVHLREGATVSQLREQLATEYPALRNLVARSALAIDEEFAAEDAAVRPEAVVALLPPVSGG